MARRKSTDADAVAKTIAEFDAARDRAHARQAAQPDPEAEAKREVAEFAAAHPELRQWRVRVTHPALGAIPWTGGRFLPPRWQASVDAPHLDFTAELAMSADPERGPVCRSLTFHARKDGPPLTARAVRDMPVGALIDHAIAAAAGRSMSGFTVEPDEPGDASAAIRASWPAGSDAFLRRVAQVYASAPDAPLKAVERELRANSRRTASNWVRDARKRFPNLMPDPKTGRKPKKERNDG